MHDLARLLRERIANGLKRKSVRSCSVWSESYRVMGQPYPGLLSHKWHPWTRAMRDCDAELMVGQKAAQLGYTEVALDKCYYAIDIKGTSVMYVLPASNPDASDFSTSRFDPALELSPHLRNLFSDVKNIGHKRAGSANLYIRGSRSRSQLKSVPVGLLILDELDEFNQDNIPLIFERLSGQREKQTFMLSTPTIDHFGINSYFRKSTQNHFFFVCPHCSKWTELTFPECLVITAEDWSDPSIYDSHLICKECKHELDHQAKPEWLSKNRWIPTFSDRIIEGFHVNQLYSPTVEPYKLAESYLKGLSNPSDEQEFYNSKLGLTHVVEGARVQDDNIQNCTGQHRKVHTFSGGLVTMGIDVGKWLHFEITLWHRDGNDPDPNVRAFGKVLYEGKVTNFEELDTYMRDFNVVHAVIDANPERRKALEFAQRNYGRVHMCFYANGVSARNLNINDELHTVSVDRTSWLDMSLGRFHNERIKIPLDASEEYKRHLKALVRIYKKDALGNPIGKYERGSLDDHYAHARNYSEIALNLAVRNAQHSNLEEVY